MNCLYCQKEVPQTDSKRNKLYCDEACRSAYRRKVSNPVESLPVASISGQKTDPADVIENYGQENCQCMHCKTKRINKSANIINHGPYEPANMLLTGEINRVSLSGDPDYKPT